MGTDPFSAGNFLRRKIGKVISRMHARQEVRVRGLLEKELLNAAEAILQEPYQQTVVRDIKKMVVGNDSIQFRFKNGTVTTWQRK